MEKTDLNSVFYFLVTEDLHVEAGAEFVKLEGGAGYLLRYENREYVVLSVYLKEADGLAVQTSLLEKGETVRLISLNAGKLYFKGAAEKKNKNMYVGALRSLQGCMTVLSECVSRLEKGMTQESCKRVVLPLERQFIFLSEEYEKKYPKFSKICAQTATRLADLSSKTLYVKDLRYLLCEIAEKYVALTKAFSL